MKVCLRLDYVLLETRLSLLLAVSSLFCAAASSSRWLFSRVTAIFHQGLGLSSSKLSEMPPHFANHSYRNRSRRCLFSLLLSLFFFCCVSSSCQSYTSPRGGCRGNASSLHWSVLTGQTTEAPSAAHKHMPSLKKRSRLAPSFFLSFYLVHFSICAPSISLSFSRMLCLFENCCFALLGCFLSFFLSFIRAMEEDLGPPPGLIAQPVLGCQVWGALSLFFFFFYGLCSINDAARANTQPRASSMSAVFPGGPEYSPIMLCSRHDRTFNIPYNSQHSLLQICNGLLPFSTGL